jgi:integrase
MAKATKTSSNKWRCKAYYTDEKGKYVNKSFTAETKKEAEGQAAVFLMEMKHKKKPANKTIGDMLNTFIDNRTNTLSPSTVVGYRKIRRTAFAGLMETRAGLVDQQMYQAYVNEYAKTRKPKTVMEAHRLICRVFKENNIDIDDKAVNLPRNIKTDIKVPTTDQVKAIAELSKEKGIYLPVLFAALLGMRKSEILALTWRDINTDNKTVRIDKAIVRDEFGEYIVKSTKTAESTRALQLPQQIIKALPERGADTDRVIDMTFGSFEFRFKWVVDTLDYKCSFHTLRHYNASIMLQNNIPNKYAMERMGHATDNMLKRVYQHTFEETHKQFDKDMEQFFTDSGI